VGFYTFEEFTETMTEGSEDFILFTSTALDSAQTWATTDSSDSSQSELFTSSVSAYHVHYLGFPWDTTILRYLIYLPTNATQSTSIDSSSYTAGQY